MFSAAQVATFSAGWPSYFVPLVQLSSVLLMQLYLPLLMQLYSVLLMQLCSVLLMQLCSVLLRQLHSVLVGPAISASYLALALVPQQVSLLAFSAYHLSQQSDCRV
jgi:hypothetical protein